jgi:hypothetical protein
MLSTGDKDVRFPLLHGFSYQGGFDPIKGPKKPESKVIDADPDGRTLLDLHPGMSLVKIVSLGNRDSLHVQHLHRPHHRVDGVLVVKVLIEFASAASVVVRAYLE